MMGTSEAEDFDREKMRKGYSRIGLCFCTLLFTAALFFPLCLTKPYQTLVLLFSTLRPADSPPARMLN
jgi:hypothetical protein